MWRSLAFLVTTSALAFAAETVLYRENFEHESGPLAGKVPTVSHDGSPWLTQYRGDKASFFGTGAFRGNRQNAIWLPFTPKAGHRYTLQATLLMKDGPKDRGISLGFSSMDSEKPFEKLPTYGTIVMYRNPQKVFAAFAGPGMETPVPFPSSPLVPTSVRIVLDASAPSPSDWMLAFFHEDSVVAKAVVIPPNSGNLGDIQFVGFTAVGGGGSFGEIQNFSLTETPAGE